MPLLIRWTSTESTPVGGEALRPDTLAASALEAARLMLPVGNDSAPLGDLAEVSGEGYDGHLIVEGDLRRVSGLGRGMASGRLEIRGDVGPHLAAEMAGGEVELHGSAGDWAGAEMRGGLLRIRGDAGNWLGAAYPGSRLGVREGIILAHGSAGDAVGLGMRRGLIAVGEELGSGAGRGMIAGSVFGLGPVGPGAGLGMKRGTIALFGATERAVPPTFARAGRFEPPFLAIYLRRLAALGLPIPDRPAAVVRYNGDLAAGGLGEILLG